VRGQKAERRRAREKKVLVERVRGAPEVRCLAKAKHHQAKLVPAK
jgi:hypothetical protein